MERKRQVEDEVGRVREILMQIYTWKIVWMVLEDLERALGF